MIAVTPPASMSHEITSVAKRSDAPSSSARNFSNGSTRNRRAAVMFDHERADAVVSEQQRRRHADETATDDEHRRVVVGHRVEAQILSRALARLLDCSTVWRHEGLRGYDGCGYTVFM